MSSGRVVVLAQEGPSTNIVANRLAAGAGVERVIFEQPVSRVEFLRRRVTRLGLATVVGQVMFQGLAAPLLAHAACPRRRQILDRYGLSPAPVDPALVTRVKSVNDHDTIALLRDLAPTAVVLSGTRIVADRVLRSVRAPFLNVHAGITPHYRGVHGGYWALAERRPDLCGVTVHLVDAGVDTGPVIAQAQIHPTDEDNFTTYPLLQLAEGLPLLERALEDLADGRLTARPPIAGPSRAWSHPTLAEYVRRRVAQGVR